MTGREVAQPACLDMALERLHRAAELGGRFRHGEGVIGAPHALLARRPRDGAALLDADPEVVGLELVVDDVLGRIAHCPPRRILLCGGWVMWPAPTAHVVKPWSAVGTTPAGWGAHLYGTAGAHCRTASRRLASGGSRVRSAKHFRNGLPVEDVAWQHVAGEPTSADVAGPTRSKNGCAWMTPSSRPSRALSGRA